ncbi:cytosine/adenosine deaminase-related metal-dependent hydrolase [Tamaricihabitans halophyticus]|uniref:Cytosine/adenosine deaminase-related metal-dependent hydrolase n=1 Tax=Tamaricihabitans halophyticus TaxID=1262583 RepID=A0A4R2R5B7_9PSEU|nr:8-oxoguanine deaminase [Tamaricihabitans halophyticus]TCP56938.1 cytosine/adenosine deaminase-related metal-dependent hydrolase [Tamaricihabitans halophyticus]
MIVIENCAIATVDGAGTEYESGHIAMEGAQITSVGAGPGPKGGKRIDGSGCLATPGLVNSHHHLYQWVTRGLSVESTLFEWLTELYPVWARIDAEAVSAASRAGLGWLALSGCTTSSDHHYVFPEGAGDLLAAEIAAAREIGLRFHPTRGSMDRGRSAGGLPPDSVVEDVDTVLAATEAAIDAYHDPSPESMLRIGIAPCSPFSVSSELLVSARELASARNVRLHTHLAETLDEDEFCLATHGCTPTEYLDSLGWLGEDVWLAHCVHLSDAAVKRLGATGTSVAHCPSSNARLGAGLAPARALLDAGVSVGLGVDGAASQESGMLIEELRQALYVARLRGGPTALRSRQALAMGTIGGARALGREQEIGSLEPGKLADIALWRVDGLGHADITDPVAALVLGPPAPVELLTVQGETIVERGELRTADQTELARQARATHLRLTREEQR